MLADEDMISFTCWRSTDSQRACIAHIVSDQLAEHRVTGATPLQLLTHKHDVRRGPTKKGYAMVLKDDREILGRSMETAPALGVKCDSLAAGHLWICVLMTFAAVVAFGCSSGGTTATPPARRAQAAMPPFHSLFLSQCGIACDSLDIDFGISESVMSTSQEYARKRGRTLRRIPFNAYDGIAGSAGIVILEEDNHRLHTILGVVSLDGERYAQLIDNRSPILVPMSSLHSLRTTGVWCVTPEEMSSISLKVGAAVIVVDRLWHNFGLTQPFATVATDFRLTNQGEQPCKVELARTSCACTVVEFEDGKVLGPGEEMTLKTRLSTGTRESIQQAVVLLLTDEANERKRPLVLTLFADRMPVMSVQPDSLDFGTVRNDDLPISRELKFTQTVHDRFVIEKVSASDSCIRTTTRSLPTGELASRQEGFLLGVTLIPGQLEPGPHKGKVHVATTSRYRPVVEVSLTWNVPNHFVTIPSVAAFGSVAVGESKSERVRLVSTEGGQLTAELLSAPPDCGAKIENSDGNTYVLVTPQFGQPGRFDETVVVRCASAKYIEHVSLRCSAYVKDTR